MTVFWMRANFIDVFWYIVRVFGRNIFPHFMADNHQIDISVSLSKRLERLQCLEISLARHHRPDHKKYRARMESFDYPHSLWWHALGWFGILDIDPKNDPADFQRSAFFLLRTMLLQPFPKTICHTLEIALCH